MASGAVGGLEMDRKLSAVLALCHLSHLPASSPPCLNPLNAELNPICHLLTLLGAHPILHVSRIRVKLLLAVFWQAAGYVVSVVCLGKHLQNSLHVVEVMHNKYNPVLSRVVHPVSCLECQPIR